MHFFRTPRYVPGQIQCAALNIRVRVFAAKSGAAVASLGQGDTLCNNNIRSFHGKESLGPTMFSEHVHSSELAAAARAQSMNTRDVIS